MCAGLIGYRAYRPSAPGTRIGIYGFEAAAHIITQVAVHDGREVYAFVTPGDSRAKQFARTVGATWAGPSNQPPPTALDSALIFAPVGGLVPEALSRVTPGGVVVCAGIHMSDIPCFPYRLLWEERIVRSVANLTREDARLFLDIAASVPLETSGRMRCPLRTKRLRTCGTAVFRARRFSCHRPLFSDSRSASADIPGGSEDPPLR